MTTFSPHWLLIGTALGMLAPAPPAAAEGTRIVVQTWNPAAAQPDGLQVLVNRPEGLESMARAAWDAARGRACDEVMARLPVAIAAFDKGAVAPRNEIKCQFGPASSVTLNQNGQNLKTVIVIPTNSVRLKVELDGSRPDFYIDVPFALTGTVQSHTGDRGRLMTLDSATTTIKAGAIKVDGATVVGDLAVAIAEFLKIGIPGLIAESVEKQSVPMGGVIATFNDAMAQAAPSAVAQAVEIRLWRRDGITIFSLKPNFPALPRGPVSGVVTASKGMPDCNGMTFQAVAQGPGTLDSPFANPPSFRKGGELSSTKAVSRPIGATGQPSGLFEQGVTSERRCDYRIADAPIGAAPKVFGGGAGRSATNQFAAIAPSERPARAPATNVNFTTVWSQAYRPFERALTVDRRTIEIGDPITRPLDDRIRAVGGVGPVVRPAPQQVVKPGTTAPRVVKKVQR